MVFSPSHGSPPIAHANLPHLNENLRNTDDNSTTLTRTKAMFAKKAFGYQDHSNPLTSVTATKSHHVAGLGCRCVAAVPGLRRMQL